MPNGACNTSLNSMYKTGKTQVYPTVHVKLHQTVCTQNSENTSVSNGACNTASKVCTKNTENTSVSNRACNTASNSMYKTVKKQMCPTVHVTLDQKYVQNRENTSVSNGA